MQIDRDAWREAARTAHAPKDFALRGRDLLHEDCLHGSGFENSELRIGGLIDPAVEAPMLARRRSTKVLRSDGGH